MKNKLESENKMNDQIIQKKKREYQKRQSITDRSFVFTKELLTRLEYQGNGIARALYHDPEVLLLDEATSQLDYATENQIMNDIKLIGKNKTIIIISHRDTINDYCNKILKL